MDEFFLEKKKSFISLRSEEASRMRVETSLSCLDTMKGGMFGVVEMRLSNLRVELSNMVMLWGCFAACGACTLHKVDGIMTAEEDYLQILQISSQITHKV